MGLMLHQITSPINIFSIVFLAGRIFNTRKSVESTFKYCRWKMSCPIYIFVPKSLHKAFKEGLFRSSIIVMLKHFELNNMFTHCTISINCFVQTYTTQ